MLARGARLAWNARNLVTSFLTTRALVETIALFDDLQHGISELLAREALDEIDELIMKRTFSTRDERILKEHPELMAKGIMGFIDKFGTRYGLPVRDSPALIKRPMNGAVACGIRREVTAAPRRSRFGMGPPMSGSFHATGRSWSSNGLPSTGSLAGPRAMAAVGR